MREFKSRRPASFVPSTSLSCLVRPGSPEELDPAGGANTFHEFDFRVGCRWRYVMHRPEKGHYRNECEFTKLALIAWKRHSKPLFQVVVRFDTASEGETSVVFKQVFDTPEEFRMIKALARDKNEENFDRLEEKLRRMAVLWRAAQTTRLARAKRMGNSARSQSATHFEM